LSIILAGCDGDDDDITSAPLPGGCLQSSGVYATQVVASNLGCKTTNAFQEVEEALGAPDSSASGPGVTQLEGIVSLGINGSITLFMGSCIQDLPGSDLRVFQVISREAVEVQVSENPDGPFVSLGVTACNDPPPYFDGFCEFDLAGSGLNQVRFVRIIDREVLIFPTAECDNTGVSPGADIDAVQVLHATN
jgi:hypothetical protein